MKEHCDNLKEKSFHLSGREKFFLLSSELKELIEREAKNKGSELFIEHDFTIFVKKRDEDVRTKIKIGLNSYEIGPGFYSIIGFADSGKTTLLLDIFKKTENSTFFCFGETIISNNNNIIEKPVRNHKVDFVTFETMLNGRNNIIFIDSFDFLMAYNKGFGMESNGIPKGPFQTIWALDKACKVNNLIVFGVIPIDDKRTEVLERYYEKLKIKTSGVIMPKISLNKVKYSLRYDFKSKNRISDKDTDMFEQNYF